MFQGFSDATIDFMWGIRFNNERSWFQQHKEEYQAHLYTPMKELAQEVFVRVDGAHPELGLCCKVSRIYRDARRLHGRGPYKDHLWFCIRGAGEQWHDRPTFWFELAPEQWSYGLGFWCAQASTMVEMSSSWRGLPMPGLERPQPPVWQSGITRKIFPFLTRSPTPPFCITPTWSIVYPQAWTFSCPCTAFWRLSSAMGDRGKGIDKNCMKRTARRRTYS